MEIVRACLRVLKHHGVIALVSAFAYANRYEFTPRATGVLAGKEPKLLQEAIRFVLKRGMPNSVHTTERQQQHQQQQEQQRQQQQQQKSNAPTHPAPHTSLDIQGSSFGMNNRGVSMGTGSEISTGHPPVVGSPTSFFGYTPSSLSYPPRGAGLSMSHLSATNFRFAVMAAAQNSLDIDTSAAATMRGKNDDLRLFKSALAELYCACSRNLSFGDLYLVLTSTITKVTGKSNIDSSTTSSLPTRVVGVPNLFPPALGNKNRHGSIGAVRQYNISHRTGSISEDYPDNGQLLQHQQQQQSYGPPTTLLDTSVASSPTDTYHLESLRRQGQQQQQQQQSSTKEATYSTASTTQHPLLDWEDVFKRMDHRRFVTFGLINGLITRIHCYPCFPYPFPEPSSQWMISFHNHPFSNAMAADGTSTMTASDGVAPAVGMATSSSGGGLGGGTNINLSVGATLSSSDVLQEYQLAQTAAGLMDGTRCDDELSCVLEQPFKKLVALVEAYGKHKVLLLYAERMD